MGSFLSKFLGKTRYKIKTLNQTRHIKKLCDEGVECFEINKKDIDEIEISIYSKNTKKVLKEFENCKSLEKISQTGFLGFLGFLKKNLVVFLAFIFAFCSLWFLNFFVWQIKIYAKSQPTSSQISLFLKKNNIKIGKIKKKYDLNLIKTNLKNNFDEVGLIDVFIVGQTLVINVNEKTFDATNNFNLSPIITPFDAYVEHIDVKSGTAKVKRGDVCKAGSILVEPYAKLSGKFFPCEASANIKLNCEIKKEFFFFEESEKLVRTGRKIIKNDFTIFKNFDTLKLGKIKFENYETNIAVSGKKVFPILPLKLFSVEIFELKKQKIIEKFDKENFEQNCKNEVLKEIGADKVFEEKIETQNLENGKFKTTVYFSFSKTL